MHNAISSSKAEDFNMLTITVVQPSYYSGENPDEKIADFLIKEANAAPDGSLIVLPEYSNAGGLSDKESEISALPRAKMMLNECSDIAKKKNAYVVVNVLEERACRIFNSTYLFDKNGKIAFVYDKVHLPPSEVALGVVHGDGACVCETDGIRFGFMTCYDVYFNEQIEYIANQKPDVVLIPGYQRQERTDIIGQIHPAERNTGRHQLAVAFYSLWDDHQLCGDVCQTDRYHLVHRFLFYTNGYRHGSITLVLREIGR